MKRLFAIICALLMSTMLQLGARAAENPSSWAEEYITRAFSLELVPDNLRSDYTKPTTRAEFCALAVKLYENVTGEAIEARKGFLDTSDENVEKMGALGVVNGVGNDLFAPYDPLTREQAAIVLAQLSSAAGKNLPQTPPSFDDNPYISSWAYTQVGQVQAADIMNGTGGNMFSPKAGYSREQSIITMLRLYDYLTSDPSDDPSDTSAFISVGGITVRIGDTLEQTEAVLGIADRIDPSGYDFKWHVYNSDYSKFIMVGIKGGIVEALYSNAKDFKTHDLSFGDMNESGESGIDYFTDSHDGDKIYGCLMISLNVSRIDPEDGFIEAQELENFDGANAFRVSHGLDPLEHDEIAVLTARKHSQDMADNNYFNHTNLDGLSPFDRYEQNGGEYYGTGENISAGYLFGLFSLDGLINSEGHRNNILGSHEYLGVGYAVNENSTYKYYLTQFFSS